MNALLLIITVVVLTIVVVAYLRSLVRDRTKHVEVVLENVTKGGTVEVSFREEC